MRKKTSSLAIGAAIALAVPAAQAATNWGVHDAIETSSEHAAKGSFDDILSFTLPSAGDVLSFASAVEKVFVGKPSKGTEDVFDVDNATVKLYRGSFGDATPDTQILSYQFGDGETVLHGSRHLAPGSYFHEASGNADGQGGRFFNLTSTLAPVPEPETYGMLLAGLGLMGIVARRRIKGN
ncbi:MAG: FxDxF family PEP-CTERM protein [Rugosibacter sp.]